MNLNDLFKIETLQQQKEKENVYFRKMYPFGEPQQQWEEYILKDLFNEPKKNQLANLKYLILIYREELMKNSGNKEADEERTLKFFDSQSKHLKLTKEQKTIIKTIAELENGATALEELPDAQTVIERNKTENR